MEKSIWFKRKTYGWGWTPANAKGWAVTLAFVFGLAIYPLLGRAQMVPFDNGAFVMVALVESAMLIAVCWWKGESPEWRWGDSAKEPPQK